jgi:hypothetical protein
MNWMSIRIERWDGRDGGIWKEPELRSSPTNRGRKYILQAVDFRLKERITLTSGGASSKSVKMLLDQIGKDRLGV